jgi:hypothetical protein
MLEHLAAPFLAWRQSHRDYAFAPWRLWGRESAAPRTGLRLLELAQPIDHGIRQPQTRRISIMKRRFLLLAGVLAAGSASPQMPKLDDLMKEAGKLSKAPTTGTVGAGDDKTNVAGIKEALAVGTERAVASLGRRDGYFGNAAVKILMPSSIQKVADVARMAGYQKQVDEFILSMNRSAEAAAHLLRVGKGVRGR